MNAVHLHLMLNHVPLFGTVVSVLLLLVAVWRRSDELKRVALGILVLTALLTLPVYFTGEPAEEAVEAMPGVMAPAIEAHESASKIAFASMLAAGGAALIGFVLFRRGKLIPSWFTTTVLVASLLTGLLMARTANLGGKVRHTEITGAAGGSASITEKGENENDD